MSLSSCQSPVRPRVHPHTFTDVEQKRTTPTTPLDAYAISLNSTVLAAALPDATAKAGLCLLRELKTSCLLFRSSADSCLWEMQSRHTAELRCQFLRFNLLCHLDVGMDCQTIPSSAHHKVLQGVLTLMHQPMHLHSIEDGLPGKIFCEGDICDLVQDLQNTPHKATTYVTQMGRYYPAHGNCQR